MRQALHIFRKDVRHLWPQIVVALVLVAGHAVLDVLQKPIWTAENLRIFVFTQCCSLLLVLAWWNLIAAVIHEEALPGDRQFWVTRPYSWKSLLGAKALFLLAFVNAPLLLSDCFVLERVGLPVMRNLPGLLLRQPVVSAWLILPALALATVTSGLRQFVLPLLLGAGILVVFGWNESDILLIVVLLGGSVWQFAKRQTGWVRGVMAVSFLVIAPGFPAISSQPTNVLQRLKQQVDVSRLRLSYDLSHPPLRDRQSQLGNSPGLIAGSIILPLKVSGLPAGTALMGGGAVSLDGPTDPAGIISRIERNREDYVQVISVGVATFERVKSRRVDLRTLLGVTVVSEQVRIRVPAQEQTIMIPGVGICEMHVEPPLYRFAACRSGVRRPPSTLVSIEYPGYRSEPAYIPSAGSGGELASGLSPVEKWIIPSGGFAPIGPASQVSNARISDALSHPGAELLFTPQTPLAETTREVTVANVDLSPYLQAQ